MDRIAFTVPGDPYGKARPRIVKIGQFSRMANSQKTVDYESRVAFAATEAMAGRALFDCALTIRVIARFVPPASTSRKSREAMLAGDIPPTKAPDGDNLLKVITDACNRVVYRDDALIADWRISKVYAETAGVDVVIAPWAKAAPSRWRAA